ncbi:hypothetical protein QR680_015564 [Steinernema hermaphroditum]|uniref:Uncharacterized protein n=1 Tax=Steinernema hermaphroditum TaxID=289476 RepID=A0AA39H972_9BILA|nr:hypothetical protein QR680_015564 [Steinernema hermaphroditum]
MIEMKSFYVYTLFIVVILTAITFAENHEYPDVIVREKRAAGGLLKLILKLINWTTKDDSKKPANSHG